MESLNLETLVENVDYARFVLLSALLVFARGRYVRLIVALLAGLELAYAIATNAGQTPIIWTSIILGLAVLSLVIGVIAGRGARLDPDEHAMSAFLLKGVGRSRSRHFIDQGYWLNGSPGEVLLREGEPVKQFCFLSSGEARVMMGGRPIGFCRGGDVIGGLGFFSGETAAATVILATPARFWCAPHERLQPYFDAHPDLRRRIERGMGEAPVESALDESAGSGERSAISAA